MRWSLISVRLIVAISAIGVVTSGALLATLYSFNEMRAGYDEIATKTIPELIEAGRVGQTAQAITSTAPILAAAPNVGRAEAVFGEIDSQLLLLDRHLASLEDLIGPSGMADQQIETIRANRDGLETNLNQLRAAVADRLREEAALAALSERARSVLEKIGSIDALSVPVFASETSAPAHLSTVLWRRAVMAALFELETARILDRAQLRRDSDRKAREALTRMREYQASSDPEITAPMRQSIAEITQEVADLIEAEDGVYARVDARAMALRAQDGLLTINVFLARNFIGAVAELSLLLRVETQERSEAFAATAQQKWAQLAGLMGLSVLAVVLLSLFVRTQIVVRVGALREALLARIQGDARPIPVTGSDEIADIAEAAAFFADAADEREVGLKRAKEQAEELANRADAANRAKSVFLANMSHELRTPLNAIIGFSELIQIGTDDLERDKEYATDIRSSGVHLLALINQLLDYSKIEAGQSTVDLEPIPVIDVFESIERLMRIQFQEAGITPIYTTTEDVVVMADRVAFRQIVINLLSNAAKFGYEGTDVTAKAVTDGDWVTLTVTDKGVGIGAEALPKVLQPFHQESSSYIRQAGGTGLGLAIVDSLIRLQGGTIQIESEKKVGTTITIALPSAAASVDTAPDPEHAPEADPQSEPEPDLEPAKVAGAVGH